MSRCLLKSRFEPNPFLSDAIVTRGVCRIDRCVDGCEMRALPTLGTLVVIDGDQSSHALPGAAGGEPSIVRQRRFWNSASVGVAANL
jgi:hypothetical protein